jgi:hypothetical protein
MGQLLVRLMSYMLRYVFFGVLALFAADDGPRTTDNTGATRIFWTKSDGITIGGSAPVPLSQKPYHYLTRQR